MMRGVGAKRPRPAWILVLHGLPVPV